MQIVRIEPTSTLWPAYLAHLRRVDQARWVVSEEGRPGAGLLFLGALRGEVVVGSLALRRQPIEAPRTPWSEGRDHVLRDADGEPLHETFVQTFYVEAPYRRQGVGRALQEAGIAWTRERGCIQMRSWSSLDKPENHQLKLALGFALHPAVHGAAAGYAVSGAYFVKRVEV